MYSFNIEMNFRTILSDALPSCVSGLALKSSWSPLALLLLKNNCQLKAGLMKIYKG